MRSLLSIFATLIFCCLADGFQLAQTRLRGPYAQRFPLVPSSGASKFPHAVFLNEVRKDSNVESKVDSGKSSASLSRWPFKIFTEYFKRLYFVISNKWWKFRKFIRSRIERYTIYVLECEDNKYYVGSTTNKKQRFKEHKSERGGSKWTRNHKPIRVLRQYKRVPAAYYLGLEAKVTAESMLEFGINNVRGAMFAQPRTFTLADLTSLTGFLGHYNELNYKEIEAILKDTLPPAPTDFTPSTRKGKKEKRRKAKQGDKCFKCGKYGHFAKDCPESSRCYKCGQYGHFAADCPNS